MHTTHRNEGFMEVEKANPGPKEYGPPLQAVEIIN